jgi:hypothetical protein
MQRSMSYQAKNMDIIMFIARIVENPTRFPELSFNAQHPIGKKLRQNPASR